MFRFYSQMHFVSCFDMLYFVAIAYAALCIILFLRRSWTSKKLFFIARVSLQKVIILLRVFAAVVVLGHFFRVSTSTSLPPDMAYCTALTVRRQTSCGIVSAMNASQNCDNRMRQLVTSSYSVVNRQSTTLRTAHHVSALVA